MFATLIMVANISYAELSQHALETFNHEPEVIRALLIRAAEAELDVKNVDSDWQAARLYCQASRLGSAEAQYRLGMLYASGKGVPANRHLAASMFATASLQGHYESQKMLETVELNMVELPACVVSEVEPEQAPTEPARSDNIDQYLAGLSKDKRWILQLVDTISAWYQVDPKLVLTIISVESNFATGVQSNKQAQGLMQLIPDTAERFNVKNAFNASQNIKGGVAYLRWLLAYFKGDVALAVAAYNAGEGTVNKYNGIPPFPETRQYVKKIQARYPIKNHRFDGAITEPSPIFKRRG
ncbi:lytic transglycosylase domain-containing protein [Methylotenera sp.]|uniref:lytic transglycosylase domain-containing protein n=1 Tax=Methylotenera sp. TaxID=2051956 RepID=UPI0025DBAE28|nr:transglycosylase SLT domain-containing protein [Methylotenera sp.]